MEVEISHEEEIEKYSPWAWVAGWLFAFAIAFTLFTLSDGFT